MREELQLHYFSQPPPKLEAVDEEDEEAEPASAQEIALRGYQEPCREVGLDEEAAGGNVDECKKALKSTLVNIVDLIDARRRHAKVEVWTDFEKFRAYTLQDGKRIDRKEARASPGYLASLLQRLGGPRRKKGKKGREAAWYRGASRSRRPKCGCGSTGPAASRPRNSTNHLCSLENSNTLQHHSYLDHCHSSWDGGSYCEHERGVDGKNWVSGLCDISFVFC
ncbi:hypothetical protein RB593_010074 [Gaeumannomyces tritici]